MMPKFMSSHTMHAGALRREPVNQLAQAAQNDAVVRPDWSLLGLSQRKGFYIMEAPSNLALAA